MDKKEMFNKLKSHNYNSAYYRENFDESLGIAYKLAKELKEKYKDEELTEDDRNAIKEASSPRAVYSLFEFIKSKAKCAEGLAKTEKFDKLKALNNLSVDLMEELDSTEEEAYKLARELKKEYKKKGLTKDEIHSISAAYCSVMDVYRRAEG